MIQEESACLELLHVAQDVHWAAVRHCQAEVGALGAAGRSEGGIEPLWQDAPSVQRVFLCVSCEVVDPPV